MTLTVQYSHYLPLNRVTPGLTLGPSDDHSTGVTPKHKHISGTYPPNLWDLTLRSRYPDK